VGRRCLSGAFACKPAPAALSYGWQALLFHNTGFTPARAMPERSMPALHRRRCNQLSTSNSQGRTPKATSARVTCVGKGVGRDNLEIGGWASGLCSRDCFGGVDLGCSGFDAFSQPSGGGDPLTCIPDQHCVLV
jgi:hypothetical protein